MPGGLEVGEQDAFQRQRRPHELGVVRRRSVLAQRHSFSSKQERR